jgi:hypothetical protein
MLEQHSRNPMPSMAFVICAAFSRAASPFGRAAPRFLAAAHRSASRSCAPGSAARRCAKYSPPTPAVIPGIFILFYLKKKKKKNHKNTRLNFVCMQIVN